MITVNSKQSMVLVSNSEHAVLQLLDGPLPHVFTITPLRVRKMETPSRQLALNKSPKVRERGNVGNRVSSYDDCHLPEAGRGGDG